MSCVLFACGLFLLTWASGCVQIGDLPQKVRELERNYEELKQEVENSPWSRFQRVMMEHLKKNNQLEEALTREELEKLETMHKMSEHERKVGFALFEPSQLCPLCVCLFVILGSHEDAQRENKAEQRRRR